MLRIAIPDFHTYNPRTGIGRVLHGLVDALGQHITTHDVSFRSVPLPLIRNFPLGIMGAPCDTDMVLLPKLIGTSALSHKFPFRSVAMCHDMGIIDSAGDVRAFNRFSQYVIRRELAHLRYATHIMVPSNFTKLRLIDYMPELAPKITVATPGVSDSFCTVPIDKWSARHFLQNTLNKRITGPLLLYVGNENPRKNLGFLLRVLRQLKSSFPDVTLVKVGAPGKDSNRKDTLSEALALGLIPGDDFILVESLDDNELIQAYGAADVFVSGSLYEGFGLPYIESLAVGVPVVAIKTGIIENNFPGVSIAEHNLEDFTAKVMTILNSVPAQMEDVRHYIRHRFSWKQFADTFLSMVRNVERRGIV